MRAQENEDSSSSTFRPVQEPTVSALCCFDKPILFSDLMSSPFEFDSCATGYDATQGVETPTEATDRASQQDDNVTTNADFESLFEEVDEPVGLFDFDLDGLDLASCPFTAAHKPNSVPSCLGREAMRSGVEPLLGDACPAQEPLEKKKAPKTSSQRQREEIASLRATAARLERDLQRIKFTSRQAPPIITEEPKSEDTSLMLSSLWMAVAKRQEAKRRRAEQENTYLKKQFKASVVLAKSLERSLRRRTRVQTIDNYSSSLKI